MGVSEFRLRLYLGFLNADDSDQKLKPSNRFFRNFGICPHCARKGGPFLLERLNDEGPMISRSDGESFHLVLGDRPISFPAEKSSGRTGMMTAGFWYVKERNKESGGDDGQHRDSSSDFAEAPCRWSPSDEAPGKTCRPAS